MASLVITLNCWKFFNNLILILDCSEKIIVEAKENELILIKDFEKILLFLLIHFPDKKV